MEIIGDESLLLNLAVRLAFWGKVQNWVAYFKENGIAIDMNLFKDTWLRR